MNKKAQVRYIPAIIIIILVLYFLNQSLNPKVVVINIESNLCDNLNLNIEKGTTVKWVNNGQQQVGLTFFGSIDVTLPPGAVYSLKFDKLDTYTYTCVGREARIIVR